MNQLVNQPKDQVFQPDVKIDRVILVFRVLEENPFREVIGTLKVLAYQFNFLFLDDNEIGRMFKNIGLVIKVRLKVGFEVIV